jgi:predicted kinase
MEAVVLCGVQGSGKTTLYRDRFLDTHVRISLDLLRTRAREAAFLQLCLDTRQPFVVDDTNATARERARFVGPAREAGFRVVGYVVEVDFAVAAARNAARTGKARVPEAALRDALRRFIRPDPAEGFEELWHATTQENGWAVERLVTTDRLPGL